MCSCCVDEVAAAHYNADFLVHFGAACLSPVDNLPVRYVFGRKHLDVAEFLREYTAVLTGADDVTIVVEQVCGPYTPSTCTHALPLPLPLPQPA